MYNKITLHDLTRICNNIFQIFHVNIYVIFYLLMVTQFFEKSLPTNEENIHTYENNTSFNLHNDEE